jgi:hypothetical protein
MSQFPARFALALQLPARICAGILPRGIDIAIAGADLRWHFESRH